MLLRGKFWSFLWFGIVSLTNFTDTVLKYPYFCMNPLWSLSSFDDGSLWHFSLHNKKKHGQPLVHWDSFVFPTHYLNTDTGVLGGHYFTIKYLSWKCSNSHLSKVHKTFNISFVTQLRPICLGQLWENTNLAREKDRTIIPINPFLLRDYTLDKNFSTYLIYQTL